MHEIERLFVFGDSIQDNGNLFKQLNFPLPPFYKGNFCNGKLASEYLKDTIENNFKQYDILIQNYAIGGALSSGNNPKSLFTESSLSVRDQIDRGLNQVKRFNDSDTILLNGGANNFIFVIHDEAPYINLPAIYRVASDLYSCADKLLSSGAGCIMIFNIPDITCAPFFNVLPFPNMFLKGYKKFIKYNINLQNEKIEKNISLLKNKYDKAIIKKVDLFDLQKSILKNPGQYGISNLSEPCVDSFGGVDADCNIQENLEILHNPEESLFFDYVHPTSIAQKELSNIIYKLLQ